MPRILVGVRMRPEASSVAGLTKHSCSLNENKKAIELSVSDVNHSFSFDNIFAPQSTQLQVFQASCLPIIDSALEGYNGCIFAYGQTGTGKTHTMSGASSVNGFDVAGSLSEGQGLVVRAAHCLFERARASTESFSFRLSIMEIYNETVIDLLNPASFGEGQAATFTSAFAATSAASSARLNIIETDGGVVIPNLHILPIDTVDAAIQLFFDTQMNRTVAEHELNRKSSRSHAIYTYYITKTKENKGGAKDKGEPVIHQSKIHLVDLAGSERSNKTKSVGKVQKEANYINKSLSFLEQVVLALGQASREHIPYRQSKLTHLLRDSLGGNCNTYMIACVWSKEDHIFETLSTLRFASRMKMIETHPVRNRLVAKENAPSRFILQELNNLKKELAMRDMVAAFSSPLDSSNLWKPGMSDSQLLSIYKETLNFNLKKGSTESMDVYSNNSNLPQHVQEAMAEMENGFQIHNLTQIYVMMTLMRTSLWEANDNCEEKLKKSLESALKKHSPFLSDNNGLKKIFMSNNSEVLETEKLDEIKKDSINQEEENKEEEEEEEEEENKISPEEKEKQYKIFSDGEGAELMTSYEEVKNTLKENKARQKEIISLLNEQKGIIDEMTKKIEFIARLKDIDENDEEVVYEEEFLQSNISIDQEEEIKFQLDAAKKKYRGAHKELQICKQQLTEIQSLKERAMATFLTAFNSYLTTKFT